MGGATKLEEGASEVLFTPTKRGMENVLATLEVGHNKFCGSFYMIA